MTTSSRPPRDEGRDAEDRELHALYRAGSDGVDAEPGSALDTAILAAARDELETGRPAKARRQNPWWRRWLPATSAIAVALLGVSLTLRVIDDQERQQRELLEPAASTRDEGRAEARSPAASGQVPAENAPMVGAKDAAKAAPLPSVPPTPRPAAKARNAAAPSAAPPAPAATVPKMAAPESAMKEKAEPSRFRQQAAERMTDGAATRGDLNEAEPASAAGLQKRAAESADSVAAPDSVEADEAATPLAWVESIRALLAAGRRDEARQRLARLRVRFPDYVLPDDLARLK